MPVSLSLADVQQMLQKELTVAQLKERLGEPLLPKDEQQTWGNLSYKLSDGKDLYFWFKGQYVTEAGYDKTEIIGIRSSIHTLLVQCERGDTKLIWRFEMDGKTFADLSKLEKYIKSLPKKAVVEHQFCDTPIGGQPLQTKADIDKLHQICKKADVVLIIYPGG